MKPKTKAAALLGSQPDKTGRERVSISNGTLANSRGGTEDVDPDFDTFKTVDVKGIQHNAFSNGGYVLHKVEIGDGKYSAWFDKDGNLLDAERIMPNGQSRKASQSVLSELTKIGQRYKSLKGTKRMKTKDLGVEGTHVPGEEAIEQEVELGSDSIGDGSEADDQVEPWGLQILRRKYIEHGDHLKDHEDMLGPLEDEAVRKFLEEEQEWHANRMAQMEKLFKSHKRYKDMDPLTHPDDAADLDSEEYETKDGEEVVVEDMEAGDPDLEAGVEDEYADQGDMDTLDDVGVGADSVDDRIEEGEEEPTAEEVIEGMETKDLDDDDELSEKSIRGFKEKPQKDSTAKVKLKGVRRKAMGDEDEIGEVGQKNPMLVGAALGALAGGALGGKALEDLDDNEKKACSKAAKFLKKAAEPDSEWGEDHRLNSFHYHKAMEELTEFEDEKNCKDFPAMDEVDDMAEVQEGGGKAFDEDEDGLETKDLAPDPANDSGFPAEDMDESTAKVSSAGTKGMEDLEEEKAMHPSRGVAKSISKFFKELSQTRDFGDDTRERAGAAAKALDELTEVMEEEKAMDEGDGDQLYEPGEMGEKGTSDGFDDVEDEDFDDGEMEKKAFRRKKLKKALENDDKSKEEEKGPRRKAMDEDEDKDKKSIKRKAVKSAVGSPEWVAEEEAEPEHKKGLKTKSAGDPYGLQYRIPGKGGTKQRDFKTAEEREKFVDKLMEKEGDDVEVSFSDPRPDQKSIAALKKAQEQESRSIQMFKKQLDQLMSGFANRN